MATTKPKQTPSKKNKPTASEKEEGFMDLLKGIRGEFGKISWPTPQQITGNTIVVLVMVAIVSLGMWGIDNIFRAIIWLITDEIPRHII